MGSEGFNIPSVVLFCFSLAGWYIRSTGVIDIQNRTRNIGGAGVGSDRALKARQALNVLPKSWGGASVCPQSFHGSKYDIIFNKPPPPSIVII